MPRTKNCALLRRCCVLTAAVLAIPTVARATDFTWAGTLNSDWFAAQPVYGAQGNIVNYLYNWIPQAIPQSTIDTVTINSDNANPPVLTQNVSIGSVFLDSQVDYFMHPASLTIADGVTMAANVVSGTVAFLNLGTGSRLVITQDLSLENLDVPSGSGVSFEGNSRSDVGQITLEPMSSGIAIEGTGTLTNARFIEGSSSTVGTQVLIGGLATLINPGLVQADSGGPLTITVYSVVNQGRLVAQPGGTLALNSAVIDNSAGVIIANSTAGAAGIVSFNGTTVTGGTFAGAGDFYFPPGINNFLDDVTTAPYEEYFQTTISAASLDLTAGGVLRVLNNLSLSSSSAVNIDNGGIMSFDTPQTFAAGTVNFGADGTQHLAVEANCDVTFGPGVTIQGTNGSIGEQLFIGGTNSITNNGVISANVAGGAISIVPTVFNNAGTVQAVSGASLTISIASGANTGTIQVSGAASVLTLSATTFTGTGGTIAITDGTLRLATAQIVGGAITSSGTGLLTTNSDVNSLTNVALNANVSLTAGILAINNSSFVIPHGLVDNSAVLTVEGVSTFAAGTITMGANGAPHLAGEADSTLIVMPAATIHGSMATFGGGVLFGGSSALVNHGLIAADVAGGRFDLNYTSIANDGTLNAANGATMSINVSVDNAGGTIRADQSSTVIFNGVTITGGTLAGAGDLLFTNNGSNFLDSVTVTAPLDLLSSGTARVLNNLNLLSSVNVAGGILSFENTQTLSAGTVNLQGTSAAMAVENAATLTLGSAVIINASSPQATLASQVFNGGTNALINNGTINSSGAAAVLSIIPSQLTNRGVISANSGGSVSLNTPVDNTGGTLRAGSGSTIVFHGYTVTGGTFAGAGSFVVPTSVNELLDSVSSSANINVQPSGILLVQNNLALTNTAAINLADNSALSFLNSQTFAGGTINISGATAGSVTVEADSSLLIGYGAIINSSAKAAQLGNQIIIGGTNAITNQGTIDAVAAGSSLAIASSSFTNTGLGLIHAAPGASVTINPTLIWSGGSFGGAGTITALAGASISGSVLKYDTGALVIDGSATFAPGTKLDLYQGAVILNYLPGNSPIDTIRAMLVSGFNAGAWNGQGIASTTAHQDATSLTAIGYAENADLGYTTFDGQSVTAQSLLIKYTYYGDNNLDGKVDASDFKLFLAGLAAGASSWSSGDYTYDGQVDLGNDFNLFLINYLTQGNALGDLAPLISADGNLSVAQRSAMLAVVPEPGSVEVVGAMGVTQILLSRSRRRRRRLSAKI